MLDDYFSFRKRYGDVSVLDTPTYLFGLESGREIWVDLEPGKTLVISLQAVSDAFEDGTRTVYFELNGVGRHVSVSDKSLVGSATSVRKVDRSNDLQVGASMPGTVIAVSCKAGDAVAEGDALLTLEAMKMETVVRAHRAGTVGEVLCKQGDAVQAEDLLVVLD